MQRNRLLIAALRQRLFRRSAGECGLSCGARCVGAAPRCMSSAPLASDARGISHETTEEVIRGTQASWRTFGLAASAVAGALVYLMYDGKPDGDGGGNSGGDVGGGDDSSSDGGGGDDEKGDGKDGSGSQGEHVIVNWSGTHECRPSALLQPETMAELEAIVADYHKRGEKLRPFGSALSPNGLGFSSGAMLSVALLDKVLHIDKETMRVRVQAGCRIAELAAALRTAGLTLPNYASIREQAVGGFIQVGAHGSGARIPPVDEQVVEMTLVTPGEGTLVLSESADKDLFRAARVGLGACGVVAEVVLQCVPAHQLLEHTYVSTMQEVKNVHKRMLKENQHMRYMWIPHTEAVVVVTNNPVSPGASLPPAPAAHSDAERTAPLRALLQEAKPAMGAEEVEALTWTELRDKLIAHAPLECDWIKRVNQAEAAFWRLSEGYRLGWSDELLGFDCGGQQWVLEAAFPTGTSRWPSLTDLGYMEQLLGDIEAGGWPAPAPIEQRWSAGSASIMSPAAGRKVTSWVGIIMYLPDEDNAARSAITARFKEYAKMMENGVMAKFGAVEHWAKIEVPEGEADLQQMRQRLAARYPLEQFAAARQRLDPKGILANDIVDTLLPSGAKLET